jgi:hypothetical protein
MEDGVHHDEIQGFEFMRDMVLTSWDLFVESICLDEATAAFSQETRAAAGAIVGNLRAWGLLEGDTIGEVVNVLSNTEVRRMGCDRDALGKW